jgi:putative aminopeptidase FrvX
MMNSPSRSIPRSLRSALFAAVAAAFTLAVPRVHAQSTGEALATWIGLDAPTGREATAMQIVQQAEKGWTRDALGNLVMRKGKGHPRRVIACAMDTPTYAVSEITDDGYLRLHEAGSWPSRGVMWDQYFEGQRIRVVSNGGWLPGVTAVRSTHLWRGRLPSDAPATVEELWVDVGAKNRAEVAQMGITLLDGVVRDWPTTTFSGYTAGPFAAARAGCAAVASAAMGPAPKSGETVYALTVQGGFAWAGLGAVTFQLGDVDSVFIAAPGLGRADTAKAFMGDSTSPFVMRTAPAPYATKSSVTLIAMRPMNPNSLVETVKDQDVLAYAAAVAKAAGVEAPKTLAGVAPRMMNDAIRHDSLTESADVLATFTNVYAVSGNEGLMRDAVKKLLPKWAQDVATVDSAGNLIVAAGPEKDTVVFIAHMDEIGFTVQTIAKDGTITLANRGGFFRSLWEGQPAVMHVTKGAPMTGIFLPRKTGATKQPPDMRAWFGMDSAALIARGVTVGTTLTGVKSASRLASSRFTARSIDDRAGCTSFILALRQIDPKRLTRKTYFVFSTREEIGLEGAKAFAHDHPRGVHRVYAVDTFVSSDSPLENQRFAYAPLGAGAVARALDNSSVTPPDELARLLKIVKAANIPFQYGTTNGGNDGSEYVRYGTVDVPVAWPLRYAHSPAEVVDLADILALGKVVATLATTP